MLGEVYDWIKNIVYFLLFTTLLRNLLAKEYQKYASLLFGLCLVLQIAQPLSWLHDGTRLDLLVGLGELEEYEKENVWFAESEESLEAMVYEETSALLHQQTEQLAAEEGYMLQRLELHREEGKADAQGDILGETITGFTVYLSTLAPEEVVGKLYGGKAVETVSITDIVIQLEKEGERGEAGAASKADRQKQELPDDSPEELAMKKKLADFYDMEESHINVIIPMGSNT